MFVTVDSFEWISEQFHVGGGSNYRGTKHFGKLAEFQIAGGKGVVPGNVFIQHSG